MLLASSPAFITYQSRMPAALMRSPIAFASSRLAKAGICTFQPRADRAVVTRGVAGTPAADSAAAAALRAASSANGPKRRHWIDDTLVAGWGVSAGGAVAVAAGA